MEKISTLRITLGGSIALISISMLFATLFLTYAIIRANSNIWPPISFQSISQTMPLSSTLAILLSSVSLILGEYYFKKSNKSVAQIWTLLAIFLGILFVASQGLLWKSLRDSGIYFNSGILGSIIYTFTLIHAVHMLCGLIGLLFFFKNLNKISELSVAHIAATNSNISRFWHLLCIVWLIMYFGIFIF